MGFFFFFNTLFPIGAAGLITQIVPYASATLQSDNELGSCWVTNGGYMVLFKYPNRGVLQLLDSCVLSYSQ